MVDRVGRGVLLYVLLDVDDDAAAHDLAHRLGEAMAATDERFVGYSVGEVESVELTFDEEEGGNGAG